MDTIKIKLNPYKDINIAFLNERPMSPYSELNNFVKEPMLNWANKLLSSAEREINDDYKLVICGEEFEKKFFESLQRNADSCVEYASEDYQLNTPISDRLEKLLTITKKYDINIDNCIGGMPIYSEVQLSLDSNYVYQSASENAFLIVLENKDEITQYISNSKAPIVLLLSNCNKVTCVEQGRYIWEIETERKNEIANNIVDYFVKIAVIKSINKLIKSKMNNFTDEEQDEIRMINEIDSSLRVENVPRIEVSDTYVPIVKPVPDTAKIEPYRMESTNSRVVEVQGDRLVALSVGRVTIRFYKNNEELPFAEKEVTTYQDNYVQKVAIQALTNKMGIGHSQKLAMSMFPPNADDANKYKWSVSNAAVATIDETGELIAQAAGKVLVTLETLKAKETIEIDILPDIEGISLSLSDISLYVGQTTPIQAIVYPENTYDSSCEWRTSDKRVAVIEKLDDGSDVIRATGIGNCTISCVAKNGNVTASCNVLVESTFKKRENVHTWLSITAVCFAICLVCSGLSIAVGSVVMAVLTVVSGINAIAHNKADRVWAILLMVIAVIIGLSEIGYIIP